MYQISQFENIISFSQLLGYVPPQIHSRKPWTYVLSTSNPKHLKTSTESYLSVKKCLCCTKDGISGAYEQSLTSIEENALRYFSGYVCYKIVYELLKSKHPNKIPLLLFMSDTNGFELDPERDTEMWTNIMDRGGLTHINDTMYGLFYQMEIELRKFYNIKKVISDQKSKQEIISQISKSDDVLYHWHALTEDSDNLIIIDELYSIIVTKFVTIRGFYFTASIVEAYKTACNQPLQKSKALRTKIHT